MLEILPTFQMEIQQLYADHSGAVKVQCGIVSIQENGIGNIKLMLQ
jgi:hypothetical protein